MSQRYNQPGSNPTDNHSSSGQYNNPYGNNNQGQNTNNNSGYPPPSFQGDRGYPPSPQSNFPNPYELERGGNPQQGPSRPTNNQYPYPQQPPTDGRIKAIADRYEISSALAQYLNILQHCEIVVLCDDSGSMNTPVEGTNGSRWDELRSTVQIIIEIGALFDSNGVDVQFLNRPPMRNVTDVRQVVEAFTQRPAGLTPLTAALRQIFQSAASRSNGNKRLLVFVATDGAPTDANGNVDIQSLENLMRNERQAQTTYVTFLTCTDDRASVSYLAQWDRIMQNVDVVDDYKSEREEIRGTKGPNFPFSFGDYVVKALLGAIEPRLDSLDEAGGNNNSGRF